MRIRHKSPCRSSEIHEWLCTQVSVRAANILHNRGIDTAERLVRLTDAEMSTWTNCGRKTREEILDFAEMWDMRLAQLGRRSN